jgi:hypothetical protein
MDQEFRFKKSSFSENNDHCVESARPGSDAAIRDSKQTAGPALRFEDAAFASFIGKVKADSLDLPS